VRLPASGPNGRSGGYDLVLRSDRVVLPDGTRPAAVAVHNGRIAEVSGRDAVLPARAEEDLGAVALLPGLVDTHVHVNEPGRTEWEGFATATAAAAAGGVTTIVDMPLNSIPSTVDTAALEVKRKAAGGQCFVDVGFWGGAVPGNLADLRGLHEAGVFGFKCFLAPSGVEEFPPLSWPEVEEVLEELHDLGALLVVHAEDGARLGETPASARYADFVASRPPSTEDSAVARLAGLATLADTRVHVLHLSSAGALPHLAAARAGGAPITAETCPHYLTLAAEQVPDGATEYKCCPPIRGRANADLLWQALAVGTIGCVVSDHSPCPAELKAGDFAAAWGGIASLQLGLPLVWTAARARGVPLDEVVRWMADAPARLVGLPGKGRIEAGYAADLVAFAAEEEFTVDPAALRHRHPVTPYAGQRLAGVVQRTWLAGVPVGDEPRGRLLTRGDLP
jgi:allantoinase